MRRLLDKQRTAKAKKTKGQRKSGEPFCSAAVQQMRSRQNTKGAEEVGVASLLFLKKKVWFFLYFLWLVLVWSKMGPFF